MTGLDKAREVADKIKGASAEKAAAGEKEMVAVKNELASVQANPDLVKLYQDNAEVGSQNVTGNMPFLKIHTVGKSSTNELPDGKEPNDGWFFYTPLGEQYETVFCHILTISRGFRSEGMEGKANVYNQIMGGVIVNGSVKPFLMYMSGLKLQPMWDFGKDAKKFTHAKPFPIPMFSLKVKLTTEQVKHSFGKSWVVKFLIIKDMNNDPEVVADPGFFNFLKNHVRTLEESINMLIASKETPDQDVPIASKETPDEDIAF
jgi:hypothetical protein